MIEDQRNANQRMMRKLVVMAFMMFGFGYLLVPLYEKICDVTGLNQVVKADEVSNTQIDDTRLINVEFDSNSRGGRWELRALESKKTVHPGELIEVMYELHNPSDISVLGQAIPSYGPAFASRHIKKLDCFCFTQQEIRAGETRQLPVVFVIDPEVPSEVHTITLSFTMFEVEGRGAINDGS